MGRGVGRSACLAMSLVGVVALGVSRLAEAQPNASPETGAWDGTGVESAAPGTPDHYVQPETPLVSADSQTIPPPDLSGDIHHLSTPDFILRRIAEHSDFVQPFLIPAVFPELSVRLTNAGGYSPLTRSAEIDQLAYLSLYYLDLYAPLLTLRDSEPTSTNHFRIDAKIPITFNHQALTLFFGGNIPTSGPWTDGGGVNTLVGYVAGSDTFSIQLRAGVGYDQLIGEIAPPPAASAIADATASFSFGPHASFLVQADGRKLLGQPGGTLRLWPGFRFFPLEAQTLSFAIGAQWWLDTFNAAGQFVNDFATRRIGGFVDLGYVFF